MIFAYTIIFVFGLLAGSFLNCLIYRLEKGKSFVFGRSICPKCGHELAWRDLVPVLSFIFLKRRCRYCGKKISWQYPAAEFAMGVLFVFLLYYAGIGAELFYLAFIFSGLFAIFVYDAKHFIIPDKIIYPLIAITLLRLTLSSQFLLNYLSAGLAASLFFLAIYLLSKGRWLGFADVKLALFLGIFLGWPNVLTGLFLSFLIGAIISLGLMVFKGKNLKSEVPFAPFLILGGFIAFFWGSQLLNWYLSLFFL